VSLIIVNARVADCLEVTTAILSVVGSLSTSCAMLKPQLRQVIDPGSDSKELETVLLVLLFRLLL
jgi:hypothetical protein